MEQSNIKTGFTEIDEKIGGLTKSDLICIASRPRIDKSNFVLNIVNNIAKQQTKTVIFSLDNSKNQIVNSMINIECAISNNVLETTSNLILLKENVYIHDILNITDIEQTSRKLKLQENIELIIIDNLQLIKSEQTLEEVIIRLKTLAQELNVTIIMLSQLSEESESKEDKRPTLVDLENSSEIVNYVDIIMFVYREDYYDMASEKKNIAEIIIAKNKRGTTGTVELLDIKPIYVNIEWDREN